MASQDTDEDHRSSPSQEKKNRQACKRRDDYQCVSCGTQLCLVKIELELRTACQTCADKHHRRQYDAISDRTHKKDGYKCVYCGTQLHAHHLVKRPDDEADRDTMRFIAEGEIEVGDNHYSRMINEAEGQGMTLTEYLRCIGEASPHKFDDLWLLFTLCNICHIEYHNETIRRVGNYQEILQHMRRMMKPLYRPEDLPNSIKRKDLKLREMAAKGHLIQVETNQDPVYAPADSVRVPQDPEKLAGRVKITDRGEIRIEGFSVLVAGEFIRNGSGYNSSIQRSPSA